MKKTIFFLLISFVFLICVVPIIQTVNAVDTVLNDPLNLNATDPVNDLVVRVIKVILGLVGVITLVMIIYGGLTWMTSGGSEEKIKKGKGILIWAILGLVVILSAYVILTFFITSFTEAQN